VQDATDRHASTRPRDVSGTFPATPRTALIAALADGVKSAIAAGDIDAARVAWEAMGRLIGA
jgi:hypothetical protein